MIPGLTAFRWGGAVAAVLLFWFLCFYVGRRSFSTPTEDPRLASSRQEVDRRFAELGGVQQETIDTLQRTVELDKQLILAQQREIDLLRRGKTLDAEIAKALESLRAQGLLPHDPRPQESTK